MKFCRHFERFAANLVGCLSVKEYWFEYLGTRVTEGKFANQRPFKTASINFWSGSFILLFRFSHIHNERLPFKLKFTLVSIPNTYSYTAMHSSPKIHLYSYRERPYHPSLLYSQSSKSWLY